MSVIPNHTVIPGVSYVMWVRDSKDYNANDRVYGVVYKGNSKFGHQDFGIVCQRSGKHFWTKKVNEDIPDSSWSLCLDAMEFYKAPIGTPVLLNDRAYTFAEVAAQCYKDNLFTSQEGLAYLKKKTDPPVTSTQKPLIVPTKPVAAAKDMPDRFDDIIPSNNIHVAVEETVTGVESNGGVEDVSDVEHDGDERMGEDVMDTEAKMKKVQLENKQLQKENVFLHAKVEELKARLESSLLDQQKFMTSGDAANKALSTMNEDTASTVASKLQSRLSLITTMNDNIEKLLEKMSEVQASTLMIPKIVKAVQNMPTHFGENVRRHMVYHHGLLDSRLDDLDTSNASLSEGLATVQDVLSSFGMAEGENSLNIPACINSLVAAAEQQQDHPPFHDIDGILDDELNPVDVRGSNQAGGIPSNHELYEPQLTHGIPNELRTQPQQAVGPSNHGHATPGYPNTPVTTRQQPLQEGQQAPEKISRKQKKKEKDKQIKAAKKLKLEHTAQHSQPGTNSYNNGPQLDTTHYSNRHNVYQQAVPQFVSNQLPAHRSGPQLDPTHYSNQHSVYQQVGNQVISNQPSTRWPRQTAAVSGGQWGAPPGGMSGQAGTSSQWSNQGTGSRQGSGYGSGQWSGQSGTSSGQWNNRAGNTSGNPAGNAAESGPRQGSGPGQAQGSGQGQGYSRTNQVWGTRRFSNPK